MLNATNINKFKKITVVFKFLCRNKSYQFKY